QATLRVGRQRGLARTRQAEEKSHPSVIADIGRTMHGQNSAGWQQVIQNREYRFLDLARVFGARNDHRALLKVDGDAGLRSGAISRRIRIEGRSEEYRELRIMLLRFERIRPD